MGLRDAIFGSRDASPAPVRYVGFPSDGGGVLPYSVSSLTTLGLSSVWRCLDILANGVSQLPWEEKRAGMELPPSRIVRRPTSLITRRDWTSLVVSNLALYDICYLLKMGGEDAEGVPMGLWPLSSAYVMPVLQQYPMLFPPTEYWVYGTRVSVDDLVVIRRSPQPDITEDQGGIIRLARTSFAAALSAENYASRYWQSGGAPTTVLETDQRLTPQQKLELSDAWRLRRAQGPDYAPVIDGGLKARVYGADVTAEAAVEARREMVADIGRYFGIPTHTLNAPSGDSQTYRNTTWANQDLVRYTLQNYIGAIEDAITDELPGGRYMEMDIYRLVRPDMLSEAQAIQLLVGSGVLSRNDAREYLSEPPMEDDMLMPPMSGVQPAPSPEPAQQMPGLAPMSQMP